MSIGFPVTTEWFLPFSNGKVQQHWNTTLFRKDQSSSWWTSSTSSTPSDWDTGIGVAAKFNYGITGSQNYMKGAVGQYVYVRNSVSKTVNVKFRYGHQIVAGTPGVSIYPVGLAITPALRTETLDYGIVFSY